MDLPESVENPAASDYDESLGVVHRRASGILLHPTCLPGPYGIGDLGPAAYRFLDYLEAAGQHLWQVLPLGPTGYGDSPYACFSSFAGNPLLVSIELLLSWGVLRGEDLADAPSFPDGRVDFGPLIAWKIPLLHTAARRFPTVGSAAQMAEMERFRQEQSWWLNDFALFMALKGWHEARARAKGRVAGAWNDSWDRATALRDPLALAQWRQVLRQEIIDEETVQFFFFSQWRSLRNAAAARGISIIGDLPIFVAPDSADVWAQRENFLLDATGHPRMVSGVPPDYFAATGQLWGNPLYDWGALARDGYRFWIRRITASLRMFDMVRIDHFRGFEACWAVPAGEPTAENGEWVKIPGKALFDELRRTVGEAPIIAEDLGVITPAVTALREGLGFPGMRVLQFAFDRMEAGILSADNRFLPHNHVVSSVVYTGTHDNDTCRGWWASRSPEERAYLERYVGATEPEIEWRLIRLALASVCRQAVVPLQDVLGLGSEARMNTPGTRTSLNWTWRFDERLLTAERATRLRDLTLLYGRAR